MAHAYPWRVVTTGLSLVQSAPVNREPDTAHFTNSKSQGHSHAESAQPF
jgi:hypothetical protein